MKSITHRALAVACLATFMAAGCASDRLTGPESDQPSSAVGEEPDSLSAGGVDKVTICHIPPGNPANEHTITVGAPAVPAHLDHGDRLGACDDDPCATGSDSTRLGSAVCQVGN